MLCASLLTFIRHSVVLNKVQTRPFKNVFKTILAHHKVKNICRIVLINYAYNYVKLSFHSHINISWVALRLFPDRHIPDRRFPDRRFPDHIQLPRPAQRCKVHRPIHRDARSPTSTKSLTLVGEHVCQCYGRGKCITLCSGRGINKFGQKTVGEKTIGKKTQCLSATQALYFFTPAKDDKGLIGSAP